MNKERLDDIVDVLGEQFAKTENTFVIRNQQELVKFINEPEKWKAQQMANMRKYKGILIANARKSIKEINAFTEKVYLLAYQEINKEQIEITKTEIKGEIPKSYADKIKNAKAENIKQILMLSNVAFQTHKQTVQIIDALSTPDNLYNTIKQYSQKGIENGLKINTAGQTGKVRQWSFKAYMEMKVRTTVHNEMVGEQIQAGADVDQVFYICDSFGDSAPDHEHYQGRIYYNAETKIPKEIEKIIVERKILSMQEVSGGDIKLTTRWNCRHNFHAIPMLDAIGMTEEEIVKKENLSKGKYKDDNYALTQQQRLNERTIRKYKLREEGNLKLYETTKDATFLEKANRSAQFVKKWQKENRELIKDNQALLKRNYDRENIRVVTQDLGVRYNTKKAQKQEQAT